MTLEDNVSMITVFTLSGLDETMERRAVLFSFTLLCYCLIVLVNVALIVTIILDESLHEPMYIFLCNLCINALYGTAGFYPKFLMDLLSHHHVITYAGCLFQAFVIYSAAIYDFSILAVMAYDRYVAICRPLEYHSIMTKSMVAGLISFSWICPLCCFGIIVLMSSRLTLCGSHIDKLYCENWSVVKLSCSSITANNIIGYIVILFYFAHVMFIACSYVYLIRTCRKSIEDRGRFMQTCVPHFLTLLNVTVALLFDVFYTRYGSRDLPQSLRNFLALEFLIFPPILNPLIYGLNLTQVRNRILGLFMKTKRVKS